MTQVWSVVDVKEQIDCKFCGHTLIKQMLTYEIWNGIKNEMKINVEDVKWNDLWVVNPLFLILELWTERLVFSDRGDKLVCKTQT